MNYKTMNDNENTPHKPHENNNPPPPSCQTKHGSKIVVATLWAIVLVYVLIDQLTKPCDNFETNSTRVARLTKAHSPLTNHNSTINCNSSKPGVPSPYHLSPNDGRCHFLDACVNTLLNTFVQWVALNPALGAVVTALVYAIACVMFVPGSILTLGAGASFAAALGFSLGVLVGSISVFVGAALGATLAFFLGRYMLYNIVQEKLIQKFELMQAIDAAILEVPLTVMVLLRLSPVIPFNALNYIMSGTNIPSKAYIIGLLGMLPATVAYVFVGASLHAAATSGVHGNTANTVLFVVGGVTAFVAVVLISYFAKKNLNSKLQNTATGEEGQKILQAKNDELGIDRTSGEGEH
jgi:uncharacterized membrane protein YdjX (TVP38/TMEM64 family)